MAFQRIISKLLNINLKPGDIYPVYDYFQDTRNKINYVFYAEVKKPHEFNAIKKGALICFSILKIIPQFQNNQVNPFGAVMYLSERVKDSFFARAYLGGESLYGFELVYDSEGQVPLGIYTGSLVGPIKIWKIHYPENLILTDEEYTYYSRTDYPDARLYSLN